MHETFEPRRTSDSEDVTLVDEFFLQALEEGSDEVFAAEEAPFSQDTRMLIARHRLGPRLIKEYYGGGVTVFTPN